MTNIKPPFKGAIFTIDDDGSASDKGIFDQMLDNEVQIRDDLIRLGVIKKFTGRVIDCDKETRKTQVDESSV